MGFPVFSFMEVAGMVLAQFYRERRAESAELKAEIAKLTLLLRLETAERKAAITALTRRVEVAELRAEAAEQSRRAEAERAARLEMELELAKRKNGGGESG